MSSPAEDAAPGARKQLAYALVAYAVALQRSGHLTATALRRPPTTETVDVTGITCAELASELGIKQPFAEKDLMDSERARNFVVYIEQRQSPPEERREAERLLALALAAITERRGAAQQLHAGQEHGRWPLPGTDLLTLPNQTATVDARKEGATKARLLQEMLDMFGVAAQVLPEYMSVGPTIIRLGVLPSGTTKVKQIENLQSDIQRVLQVETLRIIAPVPGKLYVGIEFPRSERIMVRLREILEDRTFQHARTTSSKLLIALGRDLTGQVRFYDLQKNRHVLIAGTSGGGKSVHLNAIIVSLTLFHTPDELELILVDAKRGVELGLYQGLPHVKGFIADKDDVPAALQETMAEMNRRYALFNQAKVRNIVEYNTLCQGDQGRKPLPARVFLIDELASVMLDKTLKPVVVPLLLDLIALGRAAGIHLILATQRPTVDVVDGTIKAQCATRVSFFVPQSNDSMVILGQTGAEKLLGRGDGLYLDENTPAAERIQFANIELKEVEALVAYWEQVQPLNAQVIQPIHPERIAQAALPLAETEEQEEEIETDAEEAEAEDLDEEKALEAYIAAFLQGQELPFPFKELTNTQIYRFVVPWVCQRPTITRDAIRFTFGIGQTRAGNMILQLQQDGIIGTDPGAGRPRPVLAYQNDRGDQPLEETSA